MFDHFFHRYNSATTFFSSSIPITLKFFIAIFIATRMSTPILKMTLKMTNLPTKQETEENNFLVGSQNILNSLREQ